ncbi:MAG: rod shape-determining protein [bacterium]|nr:rod shape-determining protein [bacterium]
MFGFFWDLVSHDMGIDLGTSNTLVFVRGKGIAIRAPSVVAVLRASKKPIAIGEEAKRMVGKTPKAILAIRPLRDGVISDFDATEAMLRHYIQKIHSAPSMIPKIPRPRVVIGIPSGVTEVERRAVHDAAIAAGARRAFLIEEPMAAAIGAGLPIHDPSGILVVDIGGGTTEIAVLSLGGIVLNRSIRVAGDEIDIEIENYVRARYGLLIGQPTAEEVKIAIGSAVPLEKEREYVIRGRDLTSGLPRSMKVGSTEIREAMSGPIRQIVRTVVETIEETPPELVSDILERGITIAGGGALVSGIDKLIMEETKMPVWVADDPLTAVVRGCGKVIEDEKLLRRVMVTEGLQ